VTIQRVHVIGSGLIGSSLSVRRAGVMIAAAVQIATPSAMMPPSVFLCVQRPDQAPGCSNVMRPTFGAMSAVRNEPTTRMTKPPASTFNMPRQS
jgi:hypothetical protein